MFRRITALVCALALAGALSWTAQAAPVTGSFGLDLVFYPVSDCDPNPSVFEPCKISYVAVKFEADLVLSMSISGLDLTSTTLFTFHGVEVQLFSAKATVGAMTFTTVLAFAPNILEFEDVRSGVSASRGWCLRDTAPGPLPAAASCANGFSAGLNLVGGFPPIELSFFELFLSDPVVQNIYLGLWTDALLTAPGNFTVSQLTPALTFRKKVAEVTLSIAGLTLGLRALFGNFGTAGAPDFRAGLVLILAGQTVSGITVRSETWVGARQGFECFGECKPASRLGFIISTFAPVPSLGGVVGPSIPFEPQEEKLFITGLTLAGIRNDIAIEFVLAGAGASSLQPTNMSITSTWRITPLRLTITNIARFGNAPAAIGGVGLDLLRDIMLFGINIGEVGATVQLDFRPTPIGAWETLFTALIMEFDPPGGKATIVALSCDTDWYFATGFGYCILVGGYPYLEVDYDIAFEVGDLSVEIVAIMVGSLLKDLAEVDIYASWSLGGAVSIDSVTILTPDALFAQKFGVTVKF
jgi:hypothetical protein